MLVELSLGLALSIAPTLGVQGERQSLEALLARARAQREVVLKALGGQVSQLVAQLEALPKTAPETQVDALSDSLVRLGPEATPLLVAQIEPGATSPDNVKRRAAAVGSALARLDTSAVTTELLALVSTGSDEGKANALRSLEISSDAARVRPALLATFEVATGPFKERCLKALIRLGGPEVDTLLAQVLSGPDRALASMALSAVTQTRRAEVAPHVRKLLGDPAFVSGHAHELLAYYQALPETVHDDEVRALVAAAVGNAPLDTRIEILEALPLFKPGLSPEFRRCMEPVLSSPESKLREAGLIAMSRLGDKNARKDLLRDYDALVQKNDTWPQAYARRAEIYFRIGDYDEAIDDYRKALQSAGSRDGSVEPETYIGLARAYVRKSKLKEASETLLRAPISIAQLQTLAEEADFRDLRDSKYGKQTFGAK